MSQQPTLVAVLDDDPHFRALLDVLLSDRGYAVTLTETLDELLGSVPPAPDVVIVDWQLDNENGLDLIGPIRAELPNVQVILATAFATPELAVEAIRRGASDFLSKPVDEARLITTLAAAERAGKLQARVSALQSGRFEGLIGSSPAMRAVFETIDNVAGADVSVMVTGESGTGKELIAKALHARSPRRKKALVALNMAAIPRELVESTLFGHEKGAFSGANQRRAGAVEEAAGGTLFLDEIGEMPLDLQSKLLRFLQERVFRRVGGRADLEIDVRIVSATNRDPLAAIKAGTLRADLYYRLNVVPITLPALRERAGDVSLLATAFLLEAAERHQRPLRMIAPSALALLEAHSWPGNVRELRHFIERMVLTQRGEVLLPSMLPKTLGTSAAIPELQGEPAPLALELSASPPPDASLGGPQELLQGATIVPLAELERLAVEHALRVCNGARKEAAERLGISQATIYRKLKAYGIN